jgi:hypothetical protein
MKELPAPYVHQKYPRFKFHASEVPRIVHTPEQEDALGADWFDSPAAVFAPAAPAPVPPTPAAKKAKA